MRNLGTLAGVAGMFLAVGVLFLVGGCPPNNPPAPECTVDADCADGETCVDSECVAAAECETDADCADGETCVDGECVAAAECETDADCAEGETCVDGECVEEATPECTVDADCAEGETCVDGECVEEATPECAVDADCGEGETCVDGECVEAAGPDGAALYAANCAGCHGVEGEGGIGPDIRLSSTAELTAGLESAIHGAIVVTAAEIAAMADYLGGA